MFVATTISGPPDGKLARTCVIIVICSETYEVCFGLVLIPAVVVIALSKTRLAAIAVRIPAVRTATATTTKLTIIMVILLTIQ